MAKQDFFFVLSKNFMSQTSRALDLRRENKIKRLPLPVHQKHLYFPFFQTMADTLPVESLSINGNVLPPLAPNAIKEHLLDALRQEHKIKTPISGF